MSFILPYVRVEYFCKHFNTSTQRTNNQIIKQLSCMTHENTLHLKDKI